MQRRRITPRDSWQSRVEQVGLTFHSVDGAPYWDESAYWEFTAKEVDRIEAATSELQRLCLEAGDHIIQKNRFAEMKIPAAAVTAIREAWEKEPPALYGRMDLACDGTSIKLLEYNADTPTSLLEAAIVQWYWLQDQFPKADQFNSLHEKLIAKWTDLKDYVTEPVFFAHDGAEEDLMTVTYLRDTAHQANLRTYPITMSEIGWEDASHRFVDLGRQPMGTIFKLYPWEWMLKDDFGNHALETLSTSRNTGTLWIEPIWKMMWSNKALLAILWELFEGHELLLPAYLDGPRGMKEYVRKPILGREGANIQAFYRGGQQETDGSYGAEGFVYQALGPVAFADNNYAVLGSWLIDGEPAGLGIRESEGLITNNTSRFVPHLFR